MRAARALSLLNRLGGANPALRRALRLLDSYGRGGWYSPSLKRGGAPALHHHLSLPRCGGRAQSWHGENYFKRLAELMLMAGPGAGFDAAAPQKLAALVKKHFDYFPKSTVSAEPGRNGYAKFTLNLALESALPAAFLRALAVGNTLTPLPRWTADSVAVDYLPGGSTRLKIYRRFEPAAFKPANAAERALYKAASAAWPLRSVYRLYRIDGPEAGATKIYITPRRPLSPEELAAALPAFAWLKKLRACGKVRMFAAGSGAGAGGEVYLE